MSATPRLPVTLPPSVHPTDPNYRRPRYTTAEAALYLTISRESLYTAVQRGELGCVKLDGPHVVQGSKRRMRFSQADLDAWIDAHRVEANPQALNDLARAKAKRTKAPRPSITHLMPPKRERLFA